jgi:hypothetical protein
MHVCTHVDLVIDDLVVAVVEVEAGGEGVDAAGALLLRLLRLLRLLLLLGLLLLLLLLVLAVLLLLVRVILVTKFKSVIAFEESMFRLKHDGLAKLVRLG